MEGELTPPVKVSCTPEEAAAAGRSLIGTLELPVPVYSAVHVDGQRSYQLARDGKTVEQPVRKCTVETLGIISVELPRVRFSVTCSGGTYIRALAAEWGRRLGCGGLLESLVRTRSGPFPVETSYSLDTVKREAGLGRTTDLLVPPETGLAPLPICGFDGDAARLLRYGRSAPMPPLATPPALPGAAKYYAPIPLKPGDHFIIMLREGGFLGVGRAEPDPARPGVMLAMPERLVPENRP
jgi:tRNA pseudouridine55 synthase